MSRKTKEKATVAIGDLEERDTILNLDKEEGKKHLMNLLLEDLIRWHHYAWRIEGKPGPKDADLKELAARIVKVLKEGKAFELVGVKEVPKPFLKSTGRILAKEGDKYRIVSDDEAKDSIKKLLAQEFKNDDLDPVTEPPYKTYKAMVQRREEAEDRNANPEPVEPKDALLLRCSDNIDDKVLEHQGGNKVIFNIASQFVTSESITSNMRVKVAFLILDGLEEADIPSSEQARSGSKYPLFLVRSDGDEDAATWHPVDPIGAGEFALSFVFEVFLEKEIHLFLQAKPDADKEDALAQIVPPSNEPIKNATEYDVLFGRGGMTNSHAGNRRFRDVIALHRPDYIRAVKMDKPNVARKIVRAIRHGNPPGRFLKKGDDGNWFDVGDRAAAEKTSQGLRERSNAEKRQRSELRRALRIRKEDLEEDEKHEEEAKKAKLDPAIAAANTAAALAPTLNYVGTNLVVPLSLNMAQIVATDKKRAEGKGKSSGGLITEGLPPNAVDEEGNILVTDHDILCGRGGLTNHHKGNKRFRDIVALHRPDYVRAPKIQKPSVARVIVRAIRNGDPPGRFLRKDDKTGKWVDVGDKKAAEKTSQALREKAIDDDAAKGGKPTATVLMPTLNTYLPITGMNPLTTANVMGNMLAGTTAVGEGGAAGKEEDGKPKAKDNKKDTTEDVIQTEVV